MKRITSTILAFTMVLALSACGSGGTESAQPAGNGKTLIAYFSFPLDDGVDTVATASRAEYDDGTLGNTNYIANLIREETGGDLFAIEVEENHYPTDDFMAMAEIAKDEIDNGDKPAMRTLLENPDDYDVIFVGYPIWWYDMPAVMYTFFEEYDFGGKTIIPFTTHGGSRLSGTLEKIKALEPDATVLEDAFTVSRESVTKAGDDVSEWICSLGLGQ